MKLSQSTFSESPKRFYAVDVAFTINELIGTVVDTIMLFITQ